MRSLSLALVALAASRVTAGSGTVWATPHDSYSSSIGVLGCKINTNRVAYWPASVDCNNVCVSLSYEGRSVKLLRIDQSGGAHDVSYDAWNYLYTGYSATEKPTAGGAIAMQYEDLDASACADLINTKDGKLPLSAANSMNFIASCIAQEGSWVGSNYAMYNILDSVCTLGYDEQCSLDLNVSNQPKCPNTLGMPVKLTSQPVYNIKYPSGQTVSTLTGEIVPPEVAAAAVVRKGGLSTGAKAGIGVGVTIAILLIAAAAFFWWRRNQKKRASLEGQSVEDEEVEQDLSSSSKKEESELGKKVMSWRIIATLKETR